MALLSSSSVPSPSAPKKKNKVALKSSEGRVFEIDEDVAKESKTIKRMLEDVGGSDAIPIPNVTGKTLEKVIEYCRKIIQTPVPDDPLVIEELKNWESEFLKVDQDFLFDIIEAANYLHISRLLDLTCKHVADMMRGKTTEEIRAIFHIVNDYSPEEEAGIRKDYCWAFE